jgi:hypothetical protein
MPQRWLQAALWRAWAKHCRRTSALMWRFLPQRSFETLCDGVSLSI